jgi:hypothetical protein
VTAQPDEVPSHARNVLQDVLRWRLTADGWGEVSAILDKLQASLSLPGPDQLAALSMASVALELSAPERLTPIDKLAVPVPDRVRERVNVLIHELTPPAGPGTDETSEAAG